MDLIRATSRPPLTAVFARPRAGWTATGATEGAGQPTEEVRQERSMLQLGKSTSTPAALASARCNFASKL